MIPEFITPRSDDGVDNYFSYEDVCTIVEAGPATAKHFTKVIGFWQVALLDFPEDPPCEDTGRTDAIAGIVVEGVNVDSGTVSYRLREWNGKAYGETRTMDADEFAIRIEAS